jgi:hypothetical protein
LVLVDDEKRFKDKSLTMMIMTIEGLVHSTPRVRGYMKVKGRLISSSTENIKLNLS